MIQQQPIRLLSKHIFCCCLLTTKKVNVHTIYYLKVAINWPRKRKNLKKKPTNKYLMCECVIAHFRCFVQNPKCSVGILVFSVCFHFWGDVWLDLFSFVVSVAIGPRIIHFMNEINLNNNWKKTICFTNVSKFECIIVCCSWEVHNDTLIFFRYPFNCKIKIMFHLISLHASWYTFLDWVFVLLFSTSPAPFLSLPRIPFARSFYLANEKLPVRDS